MAAGASDAAASYDREELGRVGAFSDGVFAIAITLLVLNLRVPQVPGSDLGHALRNLGDDFTAYAIGFAVMGRFWYGHHKMFSRLARSDVRLVTSNLALLAAIALMPFTTALIGSYNEPVAVAAYAVNVAVAAILDGVTELVAARDGLFEHQPGALEQARRAMTGAVASAALFILSIPVAYLVAPRAALWSWLLLIPLGRLLARRGRTAAA